MPLPALADELIALAPELGGTGKAVRWEELTWPEARDAAAALNAVIIPVRRHRAARPAPAAGRGYADLRSRGAGRFGADRRAGDPAALLRRFRVAWRFRRHDLSCGRRR